MTYDPTFRVDEHERTEDASRIADILARLVAGDWDRWPRDAGCGMLVSAGLSRDEALELWYTKVLPGRAYLGSYLDMVDYAVWRAQRTYARVFPRRGMFAAGRAASKVSLGIQAIWKSQHGENGRVRDNLDKLGLDYWDFEQEAGFHSYESAVPLTEPDKETATERAAAAGLPRMFTK